MSNNEIDILKRSIERQKKARKQAERILEEKSKDLYDLTLQLRETNERLENLLSEKTSELEGVFINIIDPYIVMDPGGKVIKMNQAAISLLGYNFKDEDFNLKSIIHPDYLEQSKKSFEQLYEVGTIKNFKTKIIANDKSEILVQLNASVIYDKHKKAIAAQGILRDITREEEVKQLLAVQKRQLDIIVENSPLGIVLTDKGEIIKSNQAFQNYLGYSKSEIEGMIVKEISSPEDIDESLRLMEKMEEGDIDKFTLIKRYTKKDGSQFLARTSVSAVRDSIGIMEYQVAIVEDITKEREAADLLKESESRLSSLISNLHLGVLLEDKKQNIVLSNQMFCKLFSIGKSPDELLGKHVSSVSDLVDSWIVDLPSFKKLTQTLLKEKKTVLGKIIELHGGQIIEIDYIPIYSNGLYTGHLWIFNDVTVRNNYRRNLEIQKEKYSSIIANMNLGLIEVNNDDIILLVNQSFCQMSGYSEAELLGEKGADILSVKNKELLLSKSKERLKHHSDSYEVQVKNKDGEWRYWLISGAPRYDETGKVVGTIGIHLDVTEQKQLELQKEQLLNQLESSNVALKEYAHIVSHDLKSPLRSLNALLTWMKEDYGDVLDEAGIQNLNLMEDKLEAMDNLINGILQYSSIQDDVSKNTSVDVNEVVKEIEEIIYIPPHVKINIVNTLPTIIADKTKIHQLLQNILTNAVAHIECEEGLVEIGSRDSGDCWTFRIKDNGTGIPPEYHEKIFDIFQTIGNKEGSTGIGLSIVKKIIEIYNGEICLDSAKGKGTEFYFTLAKNK